MIRLKYPLPASFYQEESREIVVSEETKKVWAVELDLLQEFDRVCRKHHIRYFADHGTLLGAARHGGFVPWDDDIDVAMERGEYEKLLAVSEKEFRFPYFFQTDDNSSEAARGHAQLRNSETAAILTCESQDGKCLLSFNQGVFIDVFPLDNLPDDEAECARFLRELVQVKGRIGLYKQALIVSRGRRGCSFSPYAIYYGLIALWTLFIGRVFHRNLLVENVKRLDRLCQRYDAIPTKRCAAIAFQLQRRLEDCYWRGDFDDPVLLPFEGMEIPVPKTYREVLMRNYGDWRRHVVGGAAHGGVIFDVEHSYKAYMDI